MLTNDDFGLEPIGMLETALYYAYLQFSVIPIGTDKKPLIEWKKYQSEIADYETIKNWFEKYPGANIGIVTGEISGIIVIDIEKDGSIDDLPETVCVKTGGGGWHYYYKHPDFPIPNKTRIRNLTDIRGDGGYVIAPPSIHPSGQKYEWVNQPANTSIADLPSWVLEENKKDHDERDWPLLLSGVSQGERNNDTAVIAGKLLNAHPKHDWESFVWPLLFAWNQQNKPPLAERELRNVFDSIAKGERAKVQSQGIYNNGLLTVEDLEKEIIPLEDLVKQEFPETRWLVNKLIPIGGISAISGKPKIGKSLIVLYLAICVASGKKFLNEFDVEHGSVLIISKEDPKRLLKERSLSFTDNYKLPIYFYTNHRLFLDTDTYIQKLKEFVLDKKIKLIIIDSFRRIFKGEENSSQVISEVHNRFKQLLSEDTTIIFIHHHGKEGFFHKKSNDPEKLRGSSDILAMSDCLLIIERKDDETLKIIQAALRQDRPVAPFLVRFINSGFEFIEYTEEDKEKRDLAKEAILTLLRDGSKKTKEIEGELIPAGHAQTTIKYALKELREAKKIARSEKRPYIYYLFEE